MIYLIVLFSDLNLRSSQLLASASLRNSQKRPRSEGKVLALLVLE